VGVGVECLPVVFETYKKSYSGEIALRFTVNMVSVSKAAADALGYPPRVRYLYDAETGRVGLVAASEDEKAYALYYRPQGGGPIGGCRGFIAKYNLRGKRFVGVLEGEMLVFTESEA
jgi:hypothetical protein